MNWLILLYFLELGYAPYYGSLNVLPDSKNEEITMNLGFIMFGAEIEIGGIIFFRGSTKTFIQEKNDSYRFVPFENDYMFGAGIKLKNIEAGYRTMCLHPGSPMNIYYERPGSTDASYEEIYIRISN